MAGKNFDISKFAEHLNAVSESDTREQITYIDMDLLDDDPDNFYAMSGIPELASNIQVCGLQQPIRVRSGENGRYTIVSGHRRRAAMKYLVTVDGLEQFREVPCIIEAEGVSAAMQELRLIFANSSTRQLTSVELSQQAEKVTALLYQLKEEGVEFPGRMRDQVAAACNTTSTKLAELKVIREKLREPFQGQFQRGELNHTAAYALARLPADIQSDVDIAMGAKAQPMIGGAAQNLLQYAESYYDAAAKQKCPDGSACGNLLGMLRGTATAPYSWHYCMGRCCLDCGSSESCKGRCAEAKRRTADRREQEKKRQEQQKKEGQKRSEGYIKKSIANAKRLLPLIEAAGLTDKDGLQIEYYQKTKVAEIRRYAGGDSGGDYLHGERFVPTSMENLKAMAKQLNCTTDFLLGLTDKPRPAPLPEGQLMIAGWMPGGTIPGPESGWCVTLMRLDDSAPPRPKAMWWDGVLGNWMFSPIGQPVALPPEAWMRLPEYAEKHSE